jgi:predicted GNAT family N-acyltransferase
MTDYEIRRVGDGATLFHAHAVRRAVFIAEQGVPEAIEMDGADEEATHVVAYDPVRGHAVGTARLRSVDGHAKVERVAVHANHRGDGLGTQLMDAIERVARTQGHDESHLHAQTAVEPFYRSLGYETVSDTFEEAGIPHVEMVKRL